MKQAVKNDKRMRRLRRRGQAWHVNYDVFFPICVYPGWRTMHRQMVYIANPIF
jgi:hypothetical protein